MGLLETRMLDFKNVIILSMNEGVLPKGKAAPSLLLYDIKRHFGLPTHQRTDSIFGYHFFRLLQRAENVFLIYDNDSSNAVAENSRFVEQLEFETKKQSLKESIHFHHNQFIPPFSFQDEENSIQIEKTAPIMEKLTKLTFSTSSLNTYINCPLKFYFDFVEKIETPKVFDDHNASAIIGTVIHAVLDVLFKQLKEKTAQFSTILSEFEKNIDNLLIKIFRKQPEIGVLELFQGKLFLAYEIVKKSILDYIKVIREEWTESVYQIIGTEIPLSADVSIRDYLVRIYGKIDRVEMRNNKVTILDYKTGKVVASKLKCKTEAFEDIFTKPDYSQLFQMLCYAFLYQQGNHPDLIQTAEIQCGIIAFQELYQQNEDYIFYAEIDKDKILSRDLLQLFEDYLKKLLSAILDENIAFYQTENEENCKYCDYKSICNL
jgi:ATP-dependent helicase/DNAse subunit B